MSNGNEMRNWVDFIYGKRVAIFGPCSWLEVPADIYWDIGVLLNESTTAVFAGDILFNNSSEHPRPNHAGLFYFHSTLCRQSITLDSKDVIPFLSGPRPWEEMIGASPEILSDNAWHHSLNFSPLCGLIALRKVLQGFPAKVYMLQQNLYNGDQSLAGAHDLKANAEYLKRLTDTDRRIELCPELREVMNELAL